MNGIVKILGWHARVNIRKAFHTLAELLFVHLQRQYSAGRSECQAMELAMAVTMELLGPPPPGVSLKPYPADPRAISEKLRCIREDAEVCWIVSVFRRRRNHVPGAATSATRAADDELRCLGILLPPEKILIPSTHHALMQETKKFEAWTRRD